MARRESEQRTLGELINLISANNGEDWMTVMSLDLPGHAEAMAKGEDDDFAAASEIEAEYIRAHESDVYAVEWPEHVIGCKHNGDAIYRLLKMTTATKIGNVWYADDAEYAIRDTASGWAVYRGDGRYAEFLDSDEAEEAAELLAKGEKQDSDYDWQD